MAIPSIAKHDVVSPDSERVFPSLPAVNEASGKAAKLKICLVVQDILGPTRNGGTGTAYSALATALASDGHKVTVLFANESGCDDRDFQYWKDHFLQKDIVLAEMPENTEYEFSTSKFVRLSYGVMRWLCKNENSFDAVHFPDWWGLGYYPTLLKHLGLGLQNTTLIIGMHSPTIWGREGCREMVCTVDELELDFMERESVRMADAVISPSQYMLDWLVKHGWNLPPRTYVQPNLIPKHLRAEPPTDKPVPVNELVFFGRLEERKGLALFCDAIDRSHLGENANLRITFIGKSMWIRGKKPEEFVEERARKWKCVVQIHSDFDRDAATAYLRKPGRLAIMPSFVENSPYTVLECLAMGIPFIASSIGGIPELVVPEYRSESCVPARPDPLGAAMKRAVEHGIRIARATVNFEDNEKRWLSWHAGLVRKLEPVPSSKPQAHPLVSVILVHFNRPEYLKQAIESIKKQDYDNFEVILVDSGSSLPAALDLLKSLETEFAAKGWKVVRDEDRYAGAARNLGVTHARGEYVLFMDDDNYALPEEISTFVAAAQKTDADILTSAMLMFSGDGVPASGRKKKKMWLPLGGAVAVGVFRNAFGDSNCFVKRKSFDAIGGFLEEYGVGHDDWEFHARAVLKGKRLLVIPQPLYWYRTHPGALSKDPVAVGKLDMMRPLRPYVETLPGELAGLAHFALGLWTLSRGAGAAAMPRIPPQTVVDRYWDSFSWRSTRWIRNIVNIVKDRPLEERPVIMGYPEANELVFKMTNSAYWGLTAPLRMASEILQKLTGREIAAKPKEAVASSAGGTATQHMLAEMAEQTNEFIRNEVSDQLFDIRKMLAKQQFADRKMFALETGHPVAFSTVDHKYPRGTKNDNSRNPGFVKACEAQFNHPINFLDLGCSGGGSVFDFLIRGHRGMGLEGSDYSLLRQRAEWKTIPNNLFTCDITHPFTINDLESGGAKANFHVIAIWEVLEHIAESDLPQLFANIHTHLDDNGLFVGSIGLASDIVDGVEYHQTIRPVDWWREKFREFGFDLDGGPRFGIDSFLRGRGREEHISYRFVAKKI